MTQIYNAILVFATFFGVIIGFGILLIPYIPSHMSFREKLINRGAAAFCFLISVVSFILFASQSGNP